MQSGLNLAVGDFNNFVIAQRAGMTVELVNRLFDQITPRPPGQRGWLAYARHGFDVDVANGFRIISNSRATDLTVPPSGVRHAWVSGPGRHQGAGAPVSPVLETPQHAGSSWAADDPLVLLRSASSEPHAALASRSERGGGMVGAGCLSPSFNQGPVHHSSAVSSWGGILWSPSR